ncbi:polysaccharide deacetylase family protein [Pontibacillus salicampi]|uniref:Polysaccharide deacetylase family protein n=1 Tax=Pontibacillus salicampi TaxID=1449801 RepID=A0ABV6LI78_9BACI
MRKLMNYALVSLLVFFIVFFSSYHLMNARTVQVAGKLVTEVETKEKVVALTFNGGPSKQTEQLLETLADEDVKATFFLNGSTIVKHSDQLDPLVKSPHQLGNQGYSYERMVLKSPVWIKEQIEKTDQLIREAGYEDTIPFRPPYGKKLLVLPLYLQFQQRETIMWSIEPQIYAKIEAEPESIVEHVTTNTRPGAIISLDVLYEDDVEYSMEAVKGIVEALKQDGYSFVTVSELLKYQQ